MKKTLIFLQAAIISCTAFADYENYDGQDMSNRVFDGGSSDRPLKLKYSTWVGANLSNSQFGAVGGESTKEWRHNVDLTGADFTNANLTGASFGCEPINGTSAQAYLDDAIFTNSYITYANFYGASGFTKEQLYSTASYKNKDLTGITLSSKKLSDWDFSGQNLTSVDFGYSTLTGANFTDAIISNANLNTASKEQIYSTKSYKEKNLRGVALPNIGGWDLSGQNLMLSRISYLNGTNLTKADLRGATLRTSEIPIYKNTIHVDGTIKNFSMKSTADSFSIRKYVPATEGGATISAKIGEDASISGGAELTLETGAELEITNSSLLTVSNNSSIFINTDADSSTSLSVASGAGLSFEDGAILKINVEGNFIASDTYTIAVISWGDDSRMTGLNDFTVDETLFLSVNGVARRGNWSYVIENNKMLINFVAVPEPATFAAIFGLLALGFAVRRNLKRK